MMRGMETPKAFDTRSDTRDAIAVAAILTAIWMLFMVAAYFIANAG
jgi:hypothetical protein